MSDNLHSLSEEILSWKSKYGPIFYLKIHDNGYIFRTLTRGEYLHISGAQEYIKVNISDWILKICLLYPSYSVEVLDSRLAGEVEYIFRKIIDLSGFSNGEKLLKDIEEKRNNINILDNQIVLLICKAFPHLTLQTIDNMDYDTLLRYLALSEAILDIKLDIKKTNDQGKIDFEKDNKMLGGRPIDLSMPKKQRGDVSG